MQRSSATSRGLVVLAPYHPTVTGVYLVERLFQENLVATVAFIQDDGMTGLAGRVRRLRQRQGILGVLQRWRARRLRARLLRPYRQKHLVGQLFPQGLRKLAVPPSVTTMRLGALHAPATVEALASLEPDLMVQAGVGWIKKPVLEIARLGILSLHHGIMPAIRGMDSILWAHVENRPEWMGITVQLINEGLDTGQIVRQSRVEPRPGEDPFSVVRRATILGADLMVSSVKEILSSGVPVQQPQSPEKGTYRSALTPKAVLRVHQLCVAAANQREVDKSPL